MRKYLKYLRIPLIVFLDCLFITLCSGLGLLISHDLSFETVSMAEFVVWSKAVPIQIAVTVAVFFVCRMYHYVWHSVGVHDVLEMIISVLLGSVSGLLVRLLAGRAFPAGVELTAVLLQLLTLVGMRCGFRFLDALRHAVRRSSGTERIMLIGAGEAGRMLMQEIISSTKIGGSVCCIIDDNPDKRGKYLEGVRIIGGRDQISAAVKREHITQIIFSIPTARPEDKRAILEICQETGCRVRVLPGIYQLVNGEVSLDAIKDIQVEDLLGRAPVQLDLERVQHFLQGKTILITGGGGSIGSELCRQIVRHRPKQLIIVDIYENNAYDIQQELRRKLAENIELTVEIASIRDRGRIEALFAKYRPHIVFHAAAHKHVPLMESCPAEAIKNNVFGTYHVVRAAEQSGVEKFVMISTDKAVNPTNLMGATKRLCEMILQSRVGSKTEFCAVRFGNVLGSNGSVVPLFKRQIEAGGPVTITDKRIIRYFMTIPEASQLVLEAGSMAKRGQIFVLDMGDPVKILDLAENLIRLSGLEPYRDIQIEEIGLRPGEKLYEELLMDCGKLTSTANRKIFVEEQKTIPHEEIRDALYRLDVALRENQSPETLISLMKTLVPTYRAPEEVNQAVKQ